MFYRKEIEHIRQDPATHRVLPHAIEGIPKEDGNELLTNHNEQIEHIKDNLCLDLDSQEWVDKWYSVGE